MMASSATGGADNLATVHSSISAISTGEIQLEDKLQVRCHVAVLGYEMYAYLARCL